MTTQRLHHGDCRDVMRTMDADSIDSIVCDPPYGLSFMGKGWDHGVPGVEFWSEALRVAKPGTHLLAFGGTRTFHRLTVAIEDAGWEIRDCVMWVYGSGFPKSLDVSKAIDKAAGAVREVVTTRKAADLFEAEREVAHRKKGARNGNGQNNDYGDYASADDGLHTITAPSTDAAKQWQGWGTALKPAWEPIIVARKPLVGTVAANVMQHGTGALNVDACRVGNDLITAHGGGINGAGRKYGGGSGIPAIEAGANPHTGRWPANLIHDGSDEVLAGMSDAARFFYCAKASKQDRDEGCEGMKLSRGGSLNIRTDAHSQANGMDTGPRRNCHPTVKPCALMRYLCRLVTPPSGIVLDPFMGSGSTGKAAMLEGFNFVGIDQNAEYVEIAKARTQIGIEINSEYCKISRQRLRQGGLDFS